MNLQKGDKVTVTDWNLKDKELERRLGRYLQIPDFPFTSEVTGEKDDLDYDIALCPNGKEVSLCFVKWEIQEPEAS